MEATEGIDYSAIPSGEDSQLSPNRSIEVHLDIYPH